MRVLSDEYLFQKISQISQRYGWHRVADELLGDKNFVSSEEEMLHDWLRATSYLISKILCGELDLVEQISPDSYWRLEESWLDDIKKSYAYLKWLGRGRVWSENQAKENFYSACSELRGYFYNDTVKVDKRLFSSFADSTLKCIPIKRRLPPYDFASNSQAFQSPVSSVVAD